MRINESESLNYLDMVKLFLLSALLALVPAAAGSIRAQSIPATTAPQDVVSTRELDRINWMEFREVVPARVQTVLLPTGTLEPHGVINNGADNTAPTAISRRIARRVNAMIAPTLPYGMTGSLEAYPGAFQISESAYRPFVKQVMDGLAKNGFRTSSSLTDRRVADGRPQRGRGGSGGGRRVRTLVIKWWSFAPTSPSRSSGRTAVTPV